MFNVFQDGICHPKMALVIDDRLKVWDEKDQPRVHVVPAFAPYYAPQAEVHAFDYVFGSCKIAVPHTCALSILLHSVAASAHIVLCFVGK